MEQYEHLTKALGSEFSILREIPVEDIRKTAGPLIAEGIQRLRSGQVERTPGFDGEYGKIGLLTPEDISGLEGQISLFTTTELQALNKNPKEKITGHEGHGSAGQSGNTGRNECEGPDCDSDQKPAPPTENLPPSDDSLQPAHVLTLNECQQKAAAQTGRRITVIAGPGAGKTKTLIARLHYLLDVREIPPEEITAVTFTNKAAEEMRARMDGRNLSGKTDKKRIKSSEKPAVQIGTFHAICSRFLQNVGLSFMIADTGLQTELVEKALLEFERKDSPSGLLRELSGIKNGLVQADEKNRRIYEYYQKLLLESGAMDYDDLLLETLKILKGLSEDAPERKRFSYLLIDEFQDINPLQYQLMTEWSRGGQELFVIGDPDQSIYGFRGCNPNIFRRLAVESPDLITTRLEENYRSAPDILQAALGVISHNEGEPRSMTARKAGRRPVRIAVVEDERREAIFVAKEINRQIGGIDMLDTEQSETGVERPIRGFSDIAVLYRTHRQAALLEKCLRQEGIPYQVAGREDFLNEREVRATLYFFYQALYPGEKAAESLCQKLLSHWLKESPEEQLSYLTEKYRKKIRKTRPLKLLEEWNGEINFENKEAIKKLTDMSVLHFTMEDFLRTLTFGEDGDVKRNGGRKFTSDAVTLMTLHGSKGLEFPVVFLYGMDKGRFPLEFGGANAADAIEEERRLCYVGMTRAEEELILVCGQEPSSFLQEIPSENVRWERPEKTEDKDAEKAVQMSLFDFM